MITRDNYEEFFLLYIDNELSVADREAVERYIADHPDLQKEWKTLLHCRLLPDTPLVFPDKELLYQAEGEEEEDGLPRFAPDLSIVFPDKASLYKKEEDKRIVWLPWLRVGIAAAIVGIVALLVLLSGRHIPAPSATQPLTKNNKKVTSVTPATAGALHSKEGAAEARAATAAQLPIDKPVKEKEKVKTSRKNVREEVAAVHGPAPVRPTDTAATRAADDIATKEAVTTNDVTTRDVATTRVTTADVSALQTGIPREQSSFATQELQHLENESHDPENNISVADESPAPGKGKLRGLFRKVARTFGKTADRDNDGQREVLVGAFQIALK